MQIRANHTYYTFTILKPCFFKKVHFRTGLIVALIYVYLCHVGETVLTGVYLSRKDCCIGYIYCYESVSLSRPPSEAKVNL